jgi:putative transposase
VSSSSNPPLIHYRHPCVFFRSRSDTALEVLAVRQQLAVLKRQRPRPVLNSLDRFFWTTLRSLWPTLERYPPHREARDRHLLAPRPVRLYWRWRSRPRGAARRSPKRFGRRSGAWRRTTRIGEPPKSNGELLKLSLVVSEQSVARYLRPIRRHDDPGKRWLAFLQNHREVIVAFDFFTVPTPTFQLLYCFFVIEHGRRRILYSTFSEFDDEVITLLKANGLEPQTGQASSRHERMAWRSAGWEVAGARSWIMSSR